MLRRLLVFGLVASATVVAQEPAHGVAGLSNPYTSDEDVAAGGRIFHSHCAVCHGSEGVGGRGPALDTGRFRYASSDSDLYEIISEGIPGTEMPGIFFNGRQLWQITAYVRSLSEGRAAEQATGDPEAGRKIFFGEGGCSGCHLAEGRGGRLGPQLSEIGEFRSLAHLEESVLEPNKQVLPQHWLVRATDNEGRKISGRRLNEDTYSAQLIDVDGRLLSLDKSTLAEYEVVQESAMPPYADRFSEAELADLLAYLASLRR